MAIVDATVVEFIEPNADTYQLFDYWEQAGEQQMPRRCSHYEVMNALLTEVNRQR